MATGNEGSVTRWIGDLKAGDEAAAERLWRRYFDRLVRLARAKLKADRRGAAVEDEEDAALSAFDSFCAGAAQGRFPQLGSRDDLWRLLVVITARKALDQIQRNRRLKRGGGAVVAGSALDAGDDEAAAIEQFVGAEPTPEFAAMVAEEFRGRLDALGDANLRQIALWRLEGYSNEEIAARLGCVTRTVERKLDLIRRAWSGEST